MAIKYGLTILLCSMLTTLYAQPGYWQQRVEYRMDVDMNVQRNLLTGKQTIRYFNNAPDTLDKVYFHLYWNAFRPGSLMDARSRALGERVINGRRDWDARISDRIQHLKNDEMGKVLVRSIQVQQQDLNFKLKFDGTIMEVSLSKPLLPGDSTVFEIVFEAQVPLQIRRSGRDNPKTGVQYSMSQWYPKICAYDKDGWHPTPYVAREFYGVWGNYDVTIHIDSNYRLGATGVLQNADAIGWGYDREGTDLKPVSTAKRQWHFVAENVHDFVWAADTAYRHLVRKTPDGVVLHTIYKDKPGDTANEAAWKNVADVTVQMLPFMEERFGKYAYPQYAFIQGGDGGMEYPMATLISGPGIGTVFHEWMHSWYQMMLATDESRYPWMDEGFTDYATDIVMAAYHQKIYRNQISHNARALHWLDSASAVLPLMHAGNYQSYFNIVRQGLEEPLSTHADHYETNAAYSAAVYGKGAVFLAQLGYIVGEVTRDKILLEYYHQWKFKHPNPDDFMRIAERCSGMKLDWYKEYWINTTKQIDYGIDSVWKDGKDMKVKLRRIGTMPMPIDFVLTKTDGSIMVYNISLDLMLHAKTDYAPYEGKWILSDGQSLVWPWANPDFTLTVRGVSPDEIRQMEIDPSQRMADVNRSNNIFPKQ